MRHLRVLGVFFVEAVAIKPLVDARKNLVRLVEALLHGRSKSLTSLCRS